MSYESEWFSDPVTQELLKSYNNLRTSHLVSLLQNAASSTDPNVQKHAVAIQTIDKLVREIDEKKVKEDKDER